MSVAKSMVEYLKDPDVLDPPKEIVPYLAWEGRVTLLAAREKLGKSTVAGAAIAAVTRGQPFLESGCEAARVLFVSLEEHPGDTIRKLKFFGADPENVFLITARPQSAFEDLRSDIAELRPSLVVVDSLGAFTDGMVKEAGSSTEWQAPMLEFVRLARMGPAMLLLHHSRKSDGKYRDSSAIGANVDMILEMHEDGDGRRIKAVGRWHHSGCKIRLDGDGYELLEGSANVPLLVFDFIEANPGCGKRELRSGVPKGNTAVDEALTQLLELQVVQNDGSNQAHKYRVSDAAQAALEAGVPRARLCVWGLGTVSNEDGPKKPRASATGTPRDAKALVGTGFRGTVPESNTRTTGTGHASTPSIVRPVALVDNLRLNSRRTA